MEQILQGDCLEVLRTLPDCSVDCCVTSPPYFGLRDYGVDGQIGLEETPGQYIQKLVDVFREVRRVLKDDGTFWLNIGDSYAGNSSGGIKSKDLIGIPWMLAFALRSDGWYLRQDIIWHKPNPMPESVRDRCTKSHEYVFLLSKQPHYYFDHEAIQEDASTLEHRPAGVVREREFEYASKRNLHPEAYAPKAPKAIRFGGSKYGDNKNTKFAIYSGNEWTPSQKRNKRDVWTIPAQPTKEAHFATFPEALVEPCILAGSRAGGVVLDPFFGSGTTGRVAIKNGRGYIGIELNPEYIEIAKKRLDKVQTKLF